VFYYVRMGMDSESECFVHSFTHLPIIDLRRKTRTVP
jgi:hypothetical protein